MSRLLRVAVIPVALLVAGLAVRAAVFDAPAGHQLVTLQRLFPGHPDTLTDVAMRQIGAAAGKGKPMPPSARAAMRIVERRDPLAATPFLVDGTVAQMAGDQGKAEQMFVAARLRDPRSPGPRYFLADRYFKTNRIGPGLVEMAALGRISERASQPLAPALAAYARTPGAIGPLRTFFAGSPALRDTTLDILASDAANANLVLALAPRLPVRTTPPPSWQGRLIGALVLAGNYAAADDLWRRINGIPHRGLLYDTQFRDRSAAPPFNWQLSSGSGGVAAPAAAGGLDVIYYGREPVTLATQLVRLDAGVYRIAMRVDAPVGATGLGWTVACAAGNLEPFFRLPLVNAKEGVIAGVFAVRAGNCPVQWVSLVGQPGDTASTAQVTISGLSLEPVGPRS